MKRVLLVDDDRELSELLAAQLTRGGYAVCFADSLLSAMTGASEEAPFDVLVTDLYLPDADGAAIAEALGVPIKLALTGSGAPADAERLLAAGFAEVLVKPVSGPKLLDAISRSLKTAK